MNRLQGTSHFDELYHLTSQGFADDPAALSHFSCLRSDFERVAYVQLRSTVALDDCVSETCSKDCGLARHQLDIASRDLESDTTTLENALRLCSSALRLAPHNSTESSEAMATRASVLAKLGFFEEALADCDRIIPDSNMNQMTACQILMVRATCLAGVGKWDLAEQTARSTLAQLRDTQLNNSQKAGLAGQLASLLKAVRERELSTTPRPRPQVPPCPALSQGKHPSIPSVSDALELKQSDEKGRYLVASNNIKAGSVLIVEQPFASMLAPSAWHDHCAHCCRPVRASLPCIKCTEVCFCDEACREAAWSSTHRWECGLLSQFSSSRELSAMAPLVLRVITTAGIQAMQNPPDPSDYSNPYSGTYWQEKNDTKRPVGDMIKRTITALYLEKCLEKNNFCTKEQSLMVSAALLRHLQSCSCNAYEITEHVIAPNSKSGDAVAIGGAVYSSISLANHGCHSNVARHSHGRTCVVRATRNIKAGQEILDNYGYNFLSSAKQERQHGLNRQYFFLCNCEACEKDWPIFSSLSLGNSRFKCPQCKKALGHKPSCNICNTKSVTKLLEKKLKSFITDYQNAVQNLLQGNVEESIKFLLGYILEMDDRLIHPNREFLLCQQALIRCWSLLGNVNHHEEETVP